MTGIVTPWISQTLGSLILNNLWDGLLFALDGLAIRRMSETWSRRLIIVQKAKVGLLVLLFFVLVRYAGVYHPGDGFQHTFREKSH